MRDGLKLNRGLTLFLSAGCVLAVLGADSASAQSAKPCTAMRKINIGVSVSPPNVVHTTPYVAKALGYFEKRCIDANIIQFDGGGSPASKAAAAQGTALANLTDISIAHGLTARQIWGL